MAQKEQVIKDLDKIISLIRTDSDQISADDKKKMVDDTLHYFDNYVSPGWLKYRKSVSSDSENGAVLEWQDEGAYCYGLNGEKFIDCLGGFGIYTCGHRNPEILDVVKAQLDHQALHSRSFLIRFVAILQRLLLTSRRVICSTASSQTVAQRPLRCL